MNFEFLFEGNLFSWEKMNFKVINGKFEWEVTSKIRFDN